MMPHLITPRKRVPQSQTGPTESRLFPMSPVPKKLGPPGGDSLGPDRLSARVVRNDLQVSDDSEISDGPEQG